MKKREVRELTDFLRTQVRIAKDGGGGLNACVVGAEDVKALAHWLTDPASGDGSTFTFAPHFANPMAMVTFRKLSTGAVILEVKGPTAT